MLLKCIGDPFVNTISNVYALLLQRKLTSYSMLITYEIKDHFALTL